MDGYLPRRPKPLEGMAVNLLPPRSIPDARQQLNTVMQEKPARWMFKPQLRARKFEMDMETHKASMAANERERAGKIAIQKISGGLAWMNDNKSPRFGDPTVLNDIFKNSKEAQAFIGGGFHATPTEKIHEGNKIYSIRIFNPQTNEDIVTREQTAKDMINWFDGQLLPEYRAELRSKVAANNKERARIQEKLEANPELLRGVLKGDVSKDNLDLLLGAGEESRAILEQILAEASVTRKADEAEEKKERTRKQQLHDKKMAAEEKRLKAGESLTAAQTASYSQKQSENMEKFDEDYGLKYPLTEKIQKDPEKLTAYNADKLASRNTELNRRDTENLPEKLAQERSKRRAVKILVDDATGQMVYENADGEQFTNEGCTKAYRESSQKDDNLRADGTKKGKGFKGVLKMTDGSDRVMTELSIGVNIGGKEIEIPSIVSTSTKTELDYLRSGKKPTPDIVNKAKKHAEKRMEQGLPPFYQEGEKRPKKKPSRGYDYSKGFTSQVKQAKKAITKTARGALDFINRPMTEEKRRKLPRYSRQGLGQ